MFERPGKELKDRAQEYVMWRTIAATILCAFGGILLLCGLLDERNPSTLLVLLVLVAMVGIPVLVYNVCKTRALTMYAMGQLVDDVQTIRELIQKPESENTRENAKAVVNMENAVGEEKKISAEPMIVQAEIVGDELVCPICGTKQRTERKVCWQCGQRFRE